MNIENARTDIIAVFNEFNTAPLTDMEAAYLEQLETPVMYSSSVAAISTAVDGCISLAGDLVARGDMARPVGCWILKLALTVQDALTVLQPA